MKKVSTARSVRAVGLLSHKGIVQKKASANWTRRSVYKRQQPENSEMPTAMADFGCIAAPGV